MAGVARSKQSKPVTRATPIVYFHARDNLDHTVTLSIAGKVYDFTLTPQQLDTVEFLCRKVSALKAFNFAKRRASRTIMRMT